MESSGSTNSCPRMASPTAIHEATHAVVAIQLGLTVRRLQLGGWVRIPRYCAQLYPGVIKGMRIPASICLLEEDCLDTHPREVLISMAAPSFLMTDDTMMNTYAAMEAKLAFKYARKVGIPSSPILNMAVDLAAAHEREIYDLADRLEVAKTIGGDQL
jgi:hypothetical protein